MVWCSNNWHMEQRVEHKLNNFHPKRMEVIWHTRRKNVMKEITNILDVEGAMTKTDGWFAAWTLAIKNLIDKMTLEDLTALDAQIEEISNKGYNDMQLWRWGSCCLVNANANRLAKKYHTKHVQEAMDAQFKEMGMTSVVFVYYTQPDGKLVIDA